MNDALEKQGHRKRVLVVDDQLSVRSTLGKVLTGAGYAVILAAPGAEAPRLWRESTPDLVIVDIFMPERDGIETIRELRGLQSRDPDHCDVGRGDVPTIGCAPRRQAAGRGGDDREAIRCPDHDGSGGPLPGWGAVALVERGASRLLHCRFPIPIERHHAVRRPEVYPPARCAGHRGSAHGTGKVGVRSVYVEADIVPVNRPILDGSGKLRRRRVATGPRTSERTPTVQPGESISRLGQGKLGSAGAATRYGAAGHIRYCRTPGPTYISRGRGLRVAASSASGDATKRNDQVPAMAPLLRIRLEKASSGIRYALIPVSAIPPSASERRTRGIHRHAPGCEL